MCAISMVSNYGIEKVFPGIISPPIQPIQQFSPNSINLDLSNWKYVTLQEYNALMTKAKEFDARTGQPECPDPEKIKKMEEFCVKFETMGAEMFRLSHELRSLLK
jgi:hypothetical protein